MANSKEFSHITVTADDDDDVVIQAGVVEEPAAEERSRKRPLRSRSTSRPPKRPTTR